MRHANIALLICAVCVSCMATGVRSQFRSRSVSDVTSLDSTKVARNTDSLESQLPERLYRTPVIIERGTLDAVSGFLLGASKDSLIVESLGHRRAIYYGEMRAVDILGNHATSGEWAANGALLGAYFLSLASLRDDGVLNADDFGAGTIFGVALGGAALGIVCAAPFAGGGQDEVVFDLGNDATRREKWQNLLNYIRTGVGQDNVLFEFSPGIVTPRVMARFDVPGSTFNPNFTFLRKMALYIKAREGISIGAGFVWSTEPRSNPSYYNTYSADPSGYSSQFTGTNYLVLVRVFSPLNSPFSAFTLHGEVGGGWGYQEFQPDVYSISSIVSQSGIVEYAGAGISFHVTRALSLGVGADYLFGPSMDLPVQLSTPVPTRKISTSNQSITFTLQIHP